MKKIIQGCADFEYIRKCDGVYVDKTEYLWNLISSEIKEYFLIRPRRFGKSLTLSTLKAIFQGRRELFENLAISKHEYSWDVYPVIHLSFGDYSEINASPEGVSKYLIGRVKVFAQINAIELNVVDNTPAAYFEALILALSVQKNVVILIDEYDKVITENIGHQDIGKIREALAGFYSVLKEYESKIRFLFMTGVTKFSQVSLFSKLNNLTDITRDAKYATMLGYTQKELDSYFADYLKDAAQKNKTDVVGITAEIKQWYDGFLFEEDSERVYNPVSIGKFFFSGYKFDNYWYDTGTPTLLLKVMEKNNSTIEDSLQKSVSSLDFGFLDIETMPLTALMYQSGYLTIDHAERSFIGMEYYLRFPNLEVQAAFMQFVLKYYNPDARPQNYANNAIRALYNGDVNGIIDALNEYFAQFPYDIRLKHEKYFQSMFFAFFTLCQVAIEAECHTYRGRIDAVAVAGKNCYIYEFKLDKTAAEAMKQIEQQDYCRKYLNRGLHVVKVAANFDSKTGIISDMQSETIS